MHYHDTTYPSTTSSYVTHMPAYCRALLQISVDTSSSRRPSGLNQGQNEGNGSLSRFPPYQNAFTRPWSYFETLDNRRSDPDQPQPADSAFRHPYITMPITLMTTVPSVGQIAVVSAWTFCTALPPPTVRFPVPSASQPFSSQVQA